MPKETEKLDASVVIVNHDSGSRLSPLLDTVEPQVRDVTVVDNASADGSEAAAEREGVTLLREMTNTGFSAAANRGAAQGAGSWIIFLNPDVHPEPGDLADLVSGPPDAAIVAPVQTDATGRPRAESAGFAPSLSRYIVWAVVPSIWHGRIGPWLAPPFPVTDTKVDWVSGALMTVRRETFVALNGFDERFFLYQEDVDLCRRAREAGASVEIRGAVRVYHEVANDDPARRIRSLTPYVESLGLEFEGWRRRALGGILWSGFALRALAGRRDARAALSACRALLK